MQLIYGWVIGKMLKNLQVNKIKSFFRKNVRDISVYQQQPVKCENLKENIKNHENVISATEKNGTL